MFGRKCSLCGGKLNSRNICKECGLDNTKSDKYYKINQSNCDGMPLTHVHEDTWSEPKRKKSANTDKRVTKSSVQPKYSYQQKPPAKKTKKREQDKGKKSTIGVLVTLLLVVIGAIPTALGIFENNTYSSSEPEYYSEEYDPYAYIEVVHPETGDSLSYDLTSGQYIVGVHIAPGNYYADVVDEYDSVEVTDHENSIYLYEYVAKGDMNYLSDLRLFEGAVVTIRSEEGIHLQTDNGQTGAMQSMTENFVTDSYRFVTDFEAEAGIDFEPGIYDISVTGDYGYVTLTIYEDGSEWDFRSYDLGTDGIDGPVFHNAVIPEGAVISCQESYIELVPSEMIWASDYMEHYY